MRLPVGVQPLHPLVSVIDYRLKCCLLTATRARGGWMVLYKFYFIISLKSVKWI